nr:MAG TPA: protein of unknown function (DUF5076) [Caudoviricetes sp.]
MRYWIANGRARVYIPPPTSQAQHVHGHNGARVWGRIASPK